MRTAFAAKLAFAAVLAWIPASASAAHLIKTLDLAPGNESSGYVRNLTVSNTGQTFKIRAFVLPDTTSAARPQRVSVSGLPAGTVFESVSTAGSDCASIAVTSTGNAHFAYEFSGNCDGTVTATYRTAWAVNGTSTFSAVVTDSWTDGTFSTGDDSATSSNSVNLTVDSRAVLTKASTLDSNADGYLDGYAFEFNLVPLSTLPIGNVRIFTTSKTATGLAWSWPGSYTGTLSFSDGLFLGNETPRVEIDGNADYLSGSYFAGTVNDGAAPVVSVSVAPGTYTGAVSLTLSGTESATVRYSTGGTANSGSTAYSTGLTFNTGTVLSTYVADLAGNVRTQSFPYSFVCAESAPANGSISPYPACSVSCNTGYTLSGSVCNQNPPPPSSSSSSSGGGSGSSSSGGAIVVTPPATTSTGTTTTSTGTTSTGTTTTDSWTVVVPTYVLPNRYDPSGLSYATIGLRYFDSIEEATAYLSWAVTDTVVLRVAHAYAAKLAFADSAYFLAVDAALAAEYRQALNAHVLLFLRAADARAGRLTPQGRTDALSALEILKKAYVWVPKIRERYVATFAPYGPLRSGIWRTKFEPIAPIMLKLETRYAGKFGKLYETGTIGRTEYETALAAWSDFVLHLSVYRIAGANPLSKARALSAIKTFEPTYKKRIRFTGTVQTDISPTPPPPTGAADITPSGSGSNQTAFPTDLPYASSSEDVRRLQQVLKDAGYFGTLTPTGYFGPSTKAALAKFAVEKLGIANADGTFAGNVREAMNAWLAR